MESPAYLMGRYITVLAPRFAYGMNEIDTVLAYRCRAGDDCVRSYW